MKLLIDASRNRSEGAISYLKNFVENFDCKNTKIDEIVICSYKNLLNQLPHKNFITKCNHNFLEKNILFQLCWQFFLLPKLIKKKQINILFTTDASTLCYFSRSIVMNQDLLSFDKNINTESNFLKRLRLYLIKYLQIQSLNKATVAIFSSYHSKKIISKYLYKKNNCFINYLAIDNQILNKIKKKFYSCSHNLIKKKIKLIYVSPLIDYKNHLSVIKAYNILIKNYNNVEIKFVGNYLDNLKLYNKILSNTSLSKKNFTGQISNTQVIELLYKSDIFIFASSVESFGITLLEAMAVGIPIVCSNQSSLPEILKNGGLYFHPENHFQLANQIDLLIKDYSLRKKLSIQAKKQSTKYSWANHVNKFKNILNKF